MMDRTTNANRTYTELARLDELDDYEVADKDPDIRGWDVRTSSNARIGEVDGLIADPATMQVRYVEAEIERDHLGIDSDAHVLIPIEAARLDEDDDVVYLGSLPGEGLRGTPRFGRDRLTREHDRQLSEYYGLSNTEPAERERTFFGGRREDRYGDPYYRKNT